MLLKFIISRTDRQIANTESAIWEKARNGRRTNKGSSDFQLRRRSFNYAASVDRPRTVRRRQPTALIWVSRSFAKTRCPRRRTWEHKPGQWMDRYGWPSTPCSAPCPWSLDQGSRPVLSSFVVGFARNRDSSLYLGNVRSPLKLGIGPTPLFNQQLFTA